MPDVVVSRGVRVPAWVEDLDSFRRWTHSDTFPETGWISYLQGAVWVDASMETTIHNLVKVEIARIIASLAKTKKLGRFFGDRMRITHPETGLSSEPDGLFVSVASFQRQRIQIVEGPLASELTGSPDMVLEVVSNSSVEKDIEVLPGQYWKSGVREFWLVDPRGDELHFDIFKRARSRYQAVLARNGWLKSAVFGKSFRLVKQPNTLELPEFTLQVR
jgi:Uma2 family endonuclease